MPSIELKNIANFICRDVNLRIEDRELLVLLGPIGAGKTTLLNIIAGLIEYEGSVRFNGDPVDSIQPAERKAGYLFQELFLFPHLSVAENIAYGPRMRGIPSAEREAKVSEMLSLLKLEKLSRRYPRNLSGGEKQRVALARALAIAPDVLLLDEPLRSLDAETVRQLRGEILRLWKELEITTIYVTHNLEEAYSLGERIAVLIEGKIVQIGSKRDIFEKPANAKVARYLKYTNLFNGKTEEHPEGSSVSLGHFKIVTAEKIPPGQEVTVCVREQDLKIIREGVPIRQSLRRNVFAGRIVTLSLLPDQCVMHFKIDGSPRDYDFELKFPDYIKKRHDLETGKKVRVGIWEPNIIVFRNG